MKFDVEVTDTFGGEANYCWVDRDTIEVKTDTQRAIIRAAKKAMGWNGVRCKVDNMGDEYHVRPYRLCQIMFVSWHDESLEETNKTGG